MTKKLFFLIALFISLVNSAIGQELEFTHEIKFPSNTVDKKIQYYQQNSNNGILFHGNGSIDIYQWKDDNTIAETPSLTINSPIDYKKRNIKFGADDFTFYKLYNDDGTELKGYLEIEFVPGDDFQSAVIMNASSTGYNPAFETEIWYTYTPAGDHLYYTFINNLDIAQQEVTLFKIDKEVALDGLSRTFLDGDYTYYTSSSLDISSPIESDVANFGENVILKNGSVYVSDPAYNVHQGRVIRYDINNFSIMFQGKIGKTSFPSLFNFGEYYVEGSDQEVTFSKNYGMFITSIDNNYYQHSDEGINLEYIKDVYPSHLDLVDKTSVITVIDRDPGNYELMVYGLYTGSDNIPFIDLIEVNEKDKYTEIFDIQSTTTNIYVSGIRAGIEVIDNYIIKSDLSGLDYVNSITFNPKTTNSNIALDLYGPGLISAVNLVDGKFFIYNSSLSLLGTYSFDSGFTLDNSSFASDFFTFNNNFVFSDPGKGGAIFRLPYSTIKGSEDGTDGLWNTVANWDLGVVPSADNGNVDINSSILINDIIELEGFYFEYNFVFDALTISSNGSLTIKPIDSDYKNDFTISSLTNDGVFIVNPTGQITLGNFINNNQAEIYSTNVNTLNDTKNYSLLTLDNSTYSNTGDFINEGDIVFNKAVFNSYNLTNKKKITDTISTINITNDFLNEEFSSYSGTECIIDVVNNVTNNGNIIITDGTSKFHNTFINSGSFQVNKDVDKDNTSELRVLGETTNKAPYSININNSTFISEGNLTNEGVINLDNANLEAKNDVLNNGTINNENNSSFNLGFESSSLTNNSGFNTRNNSSINIHVELTNLGFFSVDNSFFKIPVTLTNNGTIQLRNNCLVQVNSDLSDSMLGNFDDDLSTYFAIDSDEDDINFNVTKKIGYLEVRSVSEASEVIFGPELNIKYRLDLSHDWVDMTNTKITFGDGDEIVSTTFDITTDFTSLLIGELIINNETKFNPFEFEPDGSFLLVKDGIQLNNNLLLEDNFSELVIGNPSDLDNMNRDIVVSNNSYIKSTTPLTLRYIIDPSTTDRKLTFPIETKDNDNSTTYNSYLDIDLSNLTMISGEGELEYSLGVGLYLNENPSPNVFTEYEWYITTQNLGTADIQLIADVSPFTTFPTKSDEITKFLISELNYPIYNEIQQLDLTLTDNLATSDVFSVDFTALSNIEATNIALHLYSTDNTREFTSVQDGDWNDPATWDLNEVPGENAIVNIEHNITWNTLNEGFLTITSLSIINNGSLQVDLSSSNHHLRIKENLYIGENASAVMNDMDLTIFNELIIDGLFEMNTAYLDILELTTTQTTTISTNSTFQVKNVLHKAEGDLIINGTYDAQSGFNNLLEFKGTSITGDGTLNAENIVIFELGEFDDRKVNIDVEVVMTDGTFDVHNMIETTFSNKITFNNAQFESAGNVILDGQNLTDHIQEIPTVNIDALDGDPYHFITLTIRNYKEVIFSNDVLIASNITIQDVEKVTINNSSTISVDALALNEEGNPDNVAGLESFILENVDFFEGSEPNTFINLKYIEDQVAPEIYSTSFSNLISIGSPIYVSNATPNTANTYGSFIYLNQAPILFYESVEMVFEGEEGGYSVDVTSITSDTEAIYIEAITQDLDFYHHPLHPNEKIALVTLNGNEVANTSFVTKSVSIEGEDIEVEYIKINIQDLIDQGLDITMYQDEVVISVQTKHALLPEITSPISFIDYAVIPEGYVNTADRGYLINYFRSLVFKNNETLEDVFGWTDQDLTDWVEDGAVASLSDLENYIIINTEGRVTEINLLSKNIIDQDLIELSFFGQGGGEFPPLEEGEPTIGEFSINNDIELNEFPEGEIPIIIKEGELIPMELLQTVNLTGNFLDYNYLYNYEEELMSGTYFFSLIYDEIGSPFETSTINYSISATPLTVSQIGSYGEDIVEWAISTDNGISFDPVIELDGLNTFNTTIESVPENGNIIYKVTLKNEYFSDLEIVEIHSINITVGNEEKDALYNFLVDIGITGINYEDDMSSWISSDNVSIDDYGRVTSLDVSGLMNVTIVPSSISGFNYITGVVNLSNNSLEDIASLSDISNYNDLLFNVNDNNLFFDDIKPHYLANRLSDYNNQAYNVGVENIKLIHGESYINDGSLEGFSLNYKWVNSTDLSEFSSSSVFNVPLVQNGIQGSYTLIADDSDISNLEISIAQLNISYGLGQEDSLKLQEILTDIEYSNFDVNSEFRSWLGERAVIDDYGRIIELDFSEFITHDEQLLDRLSIKLNELSYLTKLEIQNNHLDFDDLSLIDGISSITTYSPQFPTPTKETHFIVQYGSFNATYEVNPLYEYSWLIKGISTPVEGTPTLDITNFNIEDEGKYSLVATYPQSPWTDLSLTVNEINLLYQSLISEADSTALHQLFTEMNVDFDDQKRIVEWPRMEYSNDGEITAIFLHELEGANELSDIIGQFDDLTLLKIYDSDITSISSNLWNITSLEYLDLSNNNLNDNELSGIENLTNLTTLWLSQNNLTRVPDISSNSGIRYLILDDNNISSIGSEFDNLTNLIDLSISGNNIETINTDFSLLTSLKKLDFSRNNLSEWTYPLPLSIEELILYTNNITEISSIPTDIILNIADNLLFFDDLEGYIITNLNYSPQRYNVKYENVALVNDGNYSYTLPFEDDNINYLWFKDGVVLNEFIGNTISIEEMNNDDAGVYTCFVSHNYWADLSLQVVEINVGLTCGSDFNVTIASNSYNTVCFGDDINIDLQANSSHSGVSYVWYKGDELLSLVNDQTINIYEEGKYSVKIQNSNGCFAYSDTIEIKYADPILVPTIVASEEFLSVDVVNPSLQYFWYLDGVLLEESGESIAKVNSGDYYVEAVNGIGCFVQSEIFTVLPSDVVTSLEDELISQISIFPLPANQELNIQLNTGLTVDAIRLIDMNGVTFPITYINHVSKLSLTTDNLKNGLYIMEITHQGNIVTHHKVMITH